MTPDADAIRERITGLYGLADGLAASDAPLAHRMRHAARDLDELLSAYEAERSGREAMQENYKRALDVISSRLYVVQAVETDDGQLTSTVTVVDEPADNPFV